MRIIKTLFVTLTALISLSSVQASNTSASDCQNETIIKNETNLKKILVEVDYIIDEMGRPYVTYINSVDYRINQRVINMIEQAEWPVRKGDIETIHSMVISLEY